MIYIVLSISDNSKCIQQNRTNNNYKTILLNGMNVAREKVLVFKLLSIDVTIPKAFNLIRNLRHLLSEAKVNEVHFK